MILRNFVEVISIIYTKYHNWDVILGIPVVARRVLFL